MALKLKLAVESQKPNEDDETGKMLAGGQHKA